MRFLIEINMSTILFIDGENFLNKLEEVFNENKIKITDWRKFDFRALFNEVLKGTMIDRNIFYFAKLNKHPDTEKKSEELIEKRRLLKTHLESQKQNFEIVISGRVRGQYEGKGFKRTLVFKEKGVDVKIAVDMVSLGCDKKLKSAILASSDSDLQPAIKELRNRGVEVIYLGFENSPNKGITYTANKTILIRNFEILAHHSKE